MARPWCLQIIAREDQILPTATRVSTKEESLHSVLKKTVAPLEILWETLSQGTQLRYPEIPELQNGNKKMFIVLSHKVLR